MGYFEVTPGTISARPVVSSFPLSQFFLVLLLTLSVSFQRASRHRTLVLGDTSPLRFQIFESSLVVVTHSIAGMSRLPESSTKDPGEYTPPEALDSTVVVVGWESDTDPQNPKKCVCHKLMYSHISDLNLPAGLTAKNGSQRG